MRQRVGAGRRRLFLLSIPMFGLLILPVAALVVGARPNALLEAVAHPSFWPALWLSVRTSLLSLLVIVIAGAPLAWWLATSSSRLRGFVEPIVELPIVLPPAVVGIALLQVFGRQGPFGVWFGVQIPFTSLAVIIAQITVAAPFFIQSATTAFRRVDPDLILVARTLGQTQIGAFRRVVIPLALPGLLSGIALAWARTLGEFGATLLFAGNLPGSTQTMPLAIYSALEADVGLAVSLSLVMLGVAVALLFAVRLVPSLWVNTDAKGGA